MVFRSTYDINIKQQKITGGQVAELIDRSPVKELIEAIVEEMVELGLKKPTESNDKTGADADGIHNLPDQVNNKRSLSRSVSERDEKDAVLAPWVEHARAKYHNYVKLIVDPGSTTGIAEGISNSAIKTKLAELQDGEYIVALIAQGSMGSANSRPHLRLAPYRDDFVNRAVRGVLTGLSHDGKSCDEIPAGMVFMYLDGCVHGNQTRFMRAFQNADGKTLPKDHKLLFLSRSQASAENDLERVAGAFGSTTCLEFVHLISAKPVQVSVIPRLYSQGDNRSDTGASRPKHET